MEAEFRIRSVREDDLDSLYRLSQLVYFLNLPADRDILKEKIAQSLASFSDEMEDKFERKYIFVLERVEDGTILGSSSLIARHGSPDEPHMYFELREIQKYSETIHSGLIHKVMRLKYDYDGPTEIGGLVVHPDFRSHRGKLGRQLSFARFTFLKMKRRWFKNHVLSELMPPLTESGESVLWEAVGRRFTNLPYQEADVLSRKNKEFVQSLFPKGDIYTCLLPGEVRDAIGKVGEGAEPVRHLLERIGFRWREHIDPFDGGPHYWADTDRITMVERTRKAVVRDETLPRNTTNLALVARFDKSEFRCAQSLYEMSSGRLRVPRATMEVLGVSPRDAVWVTPMHEPKDD